MPNTLALFALFVLSVTRYTCWLKQELCVWKRVEEESVPVLTRVFEITQTDSEGPGKVLASMPKKDASTQTDCCSNRQVTLLETDADIHK